MKIGIDVSQAIFGTGVSDYTINLVNALLETDPTNDYHLSGSSLRRSQEIKKLFPTARTYKIPPMLLHYLWNYIHAVNIENLIGRVDVFHTSDWVEPPASCPKVTTVHDLSPFLFPEQMQSGILRNIATVHAARMTWVVKESARIICVSQSAASDLQRIFKVSSEKIVVIPEALPKRFEIHPTHDQVEAIKKRFKLNNFLLAIGTPSPRKNIPRLIRAYLEFADKLRLPEKLVVVGGHGWGLADVPASDRIVFTGFLPDSEVASLLSGCEALVYPSLHEGFGLPILMGFHHRVPVVTSNVSSMPEVAGASAILVDPHSEESLAAGIAEAIKNRRSLVASGTKQLKKFSWGEAAKATLFTYSQVC